MNSAPPNLYKYRSLSSEFDRQNAKKIIKDCAIFFSSPSKFNDPFDCRPVFKIEGGKRERMKYYKALVSRQMSGHSRMERRLKVKEFTKKDVWRLGTTMDEFRSKLIADVIDRVGVLSLSSTNRNQLLWSHYADSHKGVCFEFNNAGSYFAQSQPVVYRKEYPVLNLATHDPGEFLDLTFLCKSDDWSYEQEWRLIENENGEGSYVFPRSELTGIIFGSRIEKSIRKELAALVAKYCPNASCSQATLNSDAYRIDILRHD